MLCRHLLTALPCLLLLIALPVLSGCSRFGYDPFDYASRLLDWKQVQTEHFIYHYQDNPADGDWSRKLQLFDDTGSYDPAAHSIRDAAAAYAAHFEAWYGELAALFGRSPQKKIRIYNYVDKEQQIQYSGGSADMFIDYAPADGGGMAIHMSHEGVCAHELVHIFQSLHGNPPGLLMEGMAVALAGAHWEGSTAPYTYVDRPTLPMGSVAADDTELAYWQNYPLHKLAGHVTGVNRVPAYEGTIAVRKDLRPAEIMYWGSGLQDMWSVYCLGGSFVHYLVKEHGWAPYLQLYGNVSSSQLQGTGVLQAFRDAYGSTLETLQSEWLQFLADSGAGTSWGTDYWN